MSDPYYGIPPGGYGPPPGAGYGGPPAAGYGPPPGTVFASWGRRVASFLLDVVVVIALEEFFTRVVGGAIGGLISLLLLIGGIYNYCYLQGTTGQSLGKRLLHTRLVREFDGRPAGGWLCFGRYWAHLFDLFSVLIGFLWPLWDRRRQTFADKICSTVVVDV